MKFGIIGEGNTDQVVLDKVLQGYFSDPSLETNWLQPLPGTTGNWDFVCRYLASDKLEEAYNSVDFVIVQVDSDVFLKGDVKNKLAVDFNGLTSEETVNEIRKFLVSQIADETFQKLKDLIAFAVAVNCIECWLVPVYCADTHSIEFTTDDCLATLRPYLMEKHGFALQKASKVRERYMEIGKAFLVKDDLLKYGIGNPSFSIFLSELESKTAGFEPNVIATI